MKIRTTLALLLGLSLVGAAVLVGVLVSAESSDDQQGWNASGVVTVGGLHVEGAIIDMGAVALDVTHVPTWKVTNPTALPIALRVSQPQVVVGCCPGPTLIDGAVVTPDDEVTVRAGATVDLAFPLQMHAGMDGPHHLLVPLETGSERAVLEVIADFAALARR